VQLEELVILFSYCIVLSSLKTFLCAVYFAKLVVNESIFDGILLFNAILFKISQW
jgi:hypothetical protein